MFSFYIPRSKIMFSSALGWSVIKVIYLIVYCLPFNYSLYMFFIFSIVKRLELMNTIVSFIWWVFGFFWILMGGQALLHDAPRLYW